MRNLNVDGRAKTLSQLSRNGILSSERRGAWEGEPCQQSRQKTFEFLAEWWRLTRLTGRVKEEATSLGFSYNIWTIHPSPAQPGRGPLSQWELGHN